MKKILKFNATILFMLIGMFTVKAATCTLVNDPSTAPNRTLTCDKTNQTATKFNYPDTEVTEVKNQLCTITCKEEIVLAVDPAKSVRAGMGFNYPVYLSAQRICTATYDYKGYDTTLRSLVDQRNASPNGSAQYNNFVNQITNKIQEKKDCDNWGNYKVTGSKGIYNVNPTMSLKVGTSKGDVTIPYISKTMQSGATDPRERVIEASTSTYKSCNLNDNAKANCTDNPDTVSGWTEISRLDKLYTMKDRIMELYSGKIVDKEVDSGIGKTCNAGDVYFTPFDEVTRPVEGDLTDRGYPLTLSVSNLGNNIKADPITWSLTANCWYSVKNLLFPSGGTGGTTSTSEDENYSRYGNSAIMYRTISLTDPFPNDRTPGENWFGKEYIITNNPDIRSKVIYQINLNPATISTVRDFNRNQNYVTFDLSDMEKSWFIERNRGIVDRK